MNTVTENGGWVCRGPDDQVSALSYSLPGSFLESRGGSLPESAEAMGSGDGVATDEDLKSLRGDPQFEALVAELRR